MPGQPCNKQPPPAASTAPPESFRVSSSKQIRRASSPPCALPCAICPLQTHPSRRASFPQLLGCCMRPNAWHRAGERERDPTPPTPHPAVPPPQRSPVHPYKSRSGMPPSPSAGFGGSPVTPGRWRGDAQPSARNCCSRHLSGSSNLSSAARQSSIPTLGPRDAAKGGRGEGCKWGGRDVNRVGHMHTHIKLPCCLRLSCQEHPKS